ncbi:(2Fe-2S)-binding protein [Glaciimonas sp. PCH181]|uniref:(2Fe-2S)-binding protein n=1 Tax=Glaciimonas sp. PCH181 TaxID=2133943 RepID=UPI000D35B2C5|nr:(2Fe-2S)-binding protein [Glaciimonas sp. PCH181]PUA19703.1 (2Fe-2S)-binding protein [Glaciimonas sp. PCH181]
MTLKKTVRLIVNGTSYQRDVEPRMLLSDFLRHELSLTGTHVGCEHGVCGACTILLDGAPVRSCLTFAIQVEGKEVRTVESLATNELIEERKNSMGNVEEARPITDTLSVLQASFWEHQGLQCGFCTPGVLMTMEALLTENCDPTREQVRDALSGHICRCTGYHDIVDSVMTAAKVKRSLANTGVSNQDLLRRAFLAE